MYVRVKDLDTKHQFDLPEGHPAIASGAVQLLDSPRWPASDLLRAPKHHVKLAGRSASRETATDSPVAGEATEKETQS